MPTGLFTFYVIVGCVLAIGLYNMLSGTAGLAMRTLVFGVGAGLITGLVDWYAWTDKATFYLDEAAERARLTHDTERRWPGDEMRATRDQRIENAMRIRRENGKFGAIARE